MIGITPFHIRIFAFVVRELCKKRRTKSPRYARTMLHGLHSQRNIPLGYSACGKRGLKPGDDAKYVRTIFDKYLLFGGQKQFYSMLKSELNIAITDMQVKRILADAVYCGYVRVPESKSYVQGVHDAIVSEDVFLAAQIRRAELLKHGAIEKKEYALFCYVKDSVTRRVFVPPNKRFQLFGDQYADKVTRMNSAFEAVLNKQFTQFQITKIYGLFVQVRSQIVKIIKQRGVLFAMVRSGFHPIEYSMMVEIADSERALKALFSKLLHSIPQLWLNGDFHFRQAVQDLAFPLGIFYDGISGTFETSNSLQNILFENANQVSPLFNR